MKDKKKIVIGTLCALIMVMAVGYALLSQQLRITGSAAITSNWQVEITNITEKEKSTGATTNNTNYTATTASFNTSLTSPGDYALYEVTVTNKGTLDAVLSAEPSVTTGNNTAITYELEGIAEGDKLPATTNNTKMFTIKVQYNPATTQQPNVVTSNIEVTLSYEQDLGQVSSGESSGFADGTGSVYAYEYLSYISYSEGDSIEGQDYAIDPRELNSNIYLKLNVENYLVKSVEACFVANTEHCFVRNEETDTATLSSLNQWFVECNDDGTQCDTRDTTEVPLWVDSITATVMGNDDMMCTTYGDSGWCDTQY